MKTSENCVDYDDTGHIIHEKHSDGSEKWYDANGKLLHTKHVDGSETWFDTYGNEIPMENASMNR